MAPPNVSDDVAVEKVPNISSPLESKASDQDATEMKIDAPSDPAAEAEPSPVSFTTLLRFSTKLEICLNIVGIIAAIGAGAALPLMSIMLGNLAGSFVHFSSNPTLDQIEQARAEFRSLAARNASYIVYLGLGMFVATYTYMLIWTYTGEANSRRIRERYFKAVLRQDIAYFDKVSAGEVASRIRNDTHMIQQGISEKVPLLFSALGTFFTGYILAYAKSWRLALVLSSILPAIIILGGVLATFAAKYTQLSLKHVAEGGSLAEEVISTIRTAQAFSAQRPLGTVYDVHVQKALRADYKTALLIGIGFGALFFMIDSLYALAFYYGTTLVLHDRIDIGDIVTVFSSIVVGSSSVGLVGFQARAIPQACAAGAKIFSTIDRVPTIDSESEAGLQLSSITGHIRFSNVKFNYPSRPDIPILKGLDLDFPAGKTSALVGPSGSGKSTIVSLVARFYDTLEGSIALDGTDVRELNVRWLRSQIGLVGQEPTLFDTTIRQNVAYGLVGSRFEGTTEEKVDKLVRQACTMANAHSFIETLPQGYNTLVGERGVLLSGGQKQRIAIARAIVGDPAILLLDEATSALDTHSEHVVQDALNKASEGRTTIVIAHRLSTIKDADRIYVMDSGIVAEVGTHNELLSNPDGPYSLLVNSQWLRDGEASPQSSSVTEEEAKTPATATLGSKPGTNHESSNAATNTQEAVIKSQSPATNAVPSAKEQSAVYLFKRMYQINAGSRWLYACSLVTSLLAGAIYPAVSIIYGTTIQSFQLVDRRLLRHEGDQNALHFFIIALCAGAVTGIQGWSLAHSAATLSRSIRSLVFNAILRKEIAWFDEPEHTTGALVAGLSDYPQKIQHFTGGSAGSLIQSCATIIIGAIVGLIFGWKLALVGISLFPVIVFGGYISLHVILYKDKANKAAYEDSAQAACEAAGAIRTVAALTREQHCWEEYRDRLDIPLRRSNRTSVYSTALYALSQSMTLFEVALVYWYGSILISDLTYTTKQFFICIEAVLFSTIQASGAFAMIPDVSAAIMSMRDLLDIIDTVGEHSPETGANRLGSSMGSIAFQDVRFNYPSRPGIPVLRSLHMDIKAGSYVAIVGPSGSGKSTVVQLLERFYAPNKGQILLDGEDISQFDVEDYRKHFALVSQEPTLYAGTIRFNLVVGATQSADEVTQETLDRACKEANIYDFITSLPNGYDTEVGGKGSQLSGGQKQRIAIARALLRNPQILLLDEATSALDSTSEKAVQEALDYAAKGRTTISIAHRLSSIQNADWIYFMRDGTVIESGTHDQLLERRGEYFAMVQLQVLNQAT